MKPLILIMLACVRVGTVYAQSAMSVANTCYQKKDYPCMVDNYTAALSSGAYQPGDKYQIECRIAEGHFALKQYDKAKFYYLTATETKPGELTGWWGLGDLYYNTQKFDSSIFYYHKTRSLTNSKPDQDLLTWWAGNAYVSKKDHKAALQELSEVTSRAGRMYNTDIMIGDAFLALQKYDSAIARYKKGEEILLGGDPLRKSVKYAEGQTYRKLKQYDQAIAALNASMIRDPNYFLPMWEMGIVYVEKRDYPQAIEWYKKTYPLVTDTADLYTLSGNIAACYDLINNYPESANWYKTRVVFSKRKYADYVALVKYQYKKSLQPKEAEKTAKEASMLYSLEEAQVKANANENYSTLQTILGKIALLNKDTMGASRYFDVALVSKPKNFEANLALGDVAWARRDEEEYKKYYTSFYLSGFDTSLSSNADIARAYSRNAYVEIFANKKNAGLYAGQLNSALKYDSLQKETVLLWPVILSTGPATDLTKYRNASLSLINKAIKKYESDKEYVSELYNSKAVVTDKKDTLSVRSALEQAVKINAENIRAWDNLMKYYVSYDNLAGIPATDKLIAVLKKKKDSPSVAIAFIYKGDFYWRLGRKEEAKKCYQEALIWDATNATAVERSKL